MEIVVADTVISAHTTYITDYAAKDDINRNQNFILSCDESAYPKSKRKRNEIDNDKK